MAGFHRRLKFYFVYLGRKYALHLYVGNRGAFVICRVLLVWQQMLPMALSSNPIEI
jgi:hypothetical protein